VLRANFVRRFGAEIGLEEMQHRSQDRQAGQTQCAAFVLHTFHQVVLKQGVQNDSRGFFDLGQDPIELLLRSHQWMHVFYRHHPGILRGRGPRDRDQGFTGGIRNQMEVEIARRMRHGTHESRLYKLLIAREKATVFAMVQADYPKQPVLHPHS
jgi:hypothetical protein